MLIKLQKHKIKYYGLTVTIEEARQIIDIFKEMRGLSTTYFKTKPQREVGLDEIQIAIMQGDVSSELKQRLQDKGIKYTEYNSSMGGDRNRVINQFSDLKFYFYSQNELALVTIGTIYIEFNLIEYLENNSLSKSKVKGKSFIDKPPKIIFYFFKNENTK